MDTSIMFWVAVASFGLGYLIGRARGWSTLWRGLLREGYRVIYCEDQPPGDGRLEVIEERPPF